MTKSIDNDQPNAETSHKAVSGSELPQNPTSSPLLRGLWREITSLIRRFFRFLGEWHNDVCFILVMVFIFYYTFSHEKVQALFERHLFSDAAQAVSDVNIHPDGLAAGSAPCVEDNQD